MTEGEEKQAAYAARLRDYQDANGVARPAPRTFASEQKENGHMSIPVEDLKAIAAEAGECGVRIVLDFQGLRFEAGTVARNATIILPWADVAREGNRIAYLRYSGIEYVLAAVRRAPRP
jgi:hypothetical protein